MPVKNKPLTQKQVFALAAQFRPLIVEHGEWPTQNAVDTAIKIASLPRGNDEDEGS